MSCTKAAKVLAAKKIDVVETVPASRKLGADEALKLAQGARRIVVAKGKKVTEFKFAASDADRSEVLPHMLGPTGNLRAPVIRRGTTLFIGFNEELFTELG